LAKRDRTVVATFDSADRAEKAVDKLREDGFRENEISIVARDERRKGDRDSRSYDPLSDVTATGLAVDDSRVTGGATTGAAIGAGAGLLASAGALAIPGIGPILAAGPLAATLSGAATGGLARRMLEAVAQLRLSRPTHAGPIVRSGSSRTREHERWKPTTGRRSCDSYRIVTNGGPVSRPSSC